MQILDDFQLFSGFQLGIFLSFVIAFQRMLFSFYKALLSTQRLFFSETNNRNISCAQAARLLFNSRVFNYYLVHCFARLKFRLRVIRTNSEQFAARLLFNSSLLLFLRCIVCSAPLIQPKRLMLLSLTSFAQLCANI